MFQQLAIIIGLVSFSLISTTNASSGVVNYEPSLNERFLTTVRGNVDKDIAEDGTVPSDQITWNPVLITGNALLTQLCYNNMPGNYQNPFNCTQFIMCTNDGSAYLAECAAGGSYNPIPDFCVYPGSPGAQCPWRSIWYNSDISCATIGQRLFWGLLTFPLEPEERCGQGIYYCNKYQQISLNTRCSPGCGYSKGYLGCLDIDTCNKVDDYFGL